MKNKKNSTPVKKAASKKTKPKKSGTILKAETKAVAAQPIAPPTEDGVDIDEFEAEASSLAAGSASAQMEAAVSGAKAESATSLKNFRHHPDLENFYRFIYENDLRYEALDIIHQILLDKKSQKAVIQTKSKAH